MVIVVANVKAKNGCESELGMLLEALVDPTRAEDGCLQYDLHRSDTDPTEFMFYERWQTQTHLDAHLVTPHFLETRDRTAELSAVDPVIATYTLIR